MGWRCMLARWERRLRGRWAVWCLAAMLTGCGGGAGGRAGGNEPPGAPLEPANASPGVLAISAMPRLDPMPTTEAQFVALASEAFEQVYSAGARGQMTTFTWRALEPSAGQLDQVKFSELNAAVAQSQARAMTQYLGIQLINTTVLEVPADLVNVSFDNATFMRRFRALLDQILIPHKGKIKYLAIGNEVDAYLREHPDQWAAYQRFYDDAARHARLLDPAVQIGVTATADGALQQSPTPLRALNAGSDVVILTYYPLQADASGLITVRDPAVVANDFARMLAFAGTRPLLLQEVGYPASPINQSSPAMQSAFVSEVFAAWRQSGGRIPFVNFFLLHDFTPSMCRDFGIYYQLSGLPSFTAFLCSLGLREADGTERQAWATLLNEAKMAHLP